MNLKLDSPIQWYKERKKKYDWLKLLISNQTQWIPKVLRAAVSLARSYLT